MRTYRLSESAILDIDQLYLYGVQSFGTYQANKYQTDLFEVFERISQFPGIGLPHKAQTRRFSHWPYIIIYSNDDANGLIIQAVLHGRQDWKEIDE